jgi:hypothetical protein
MHLLPWDQEEREINHVKQPVYCCDLQYPGSGLPGALLAAAIFKNTAALLSADFFLLLLLIIWSSLSCHVGRNLFKFYTRRSTILARVLVAPLRFLGDYNLLTSLNPSFISPM